MKDQKDKQCRIIFLQPVIIIFTRGAINFDHDCISNINSDANLSRQYLLMKLSNN